MIQQGQIIHRSANHPDFEREERAAVAAQQAERTAANPPRMPQGLGDLVYRFAHPIGCWLDRTTARLGPRMAWAKTGLCGCSACSRRRRFLNLILPDLRAWEGSWLPLCKAPVATLQRAVRAVYRTP